jgi:hypothetical protein
MNYVVTIFQLIPAIIAALKAIEEAIPGTGQGEQKLAAVRGMLEAVDGSYKTMWPQISGVITVLVNLFNTTGVFKK